MNHKVLLADDSLTIQKVIKITLANQPYDITDCSNEEELFHQLPIVQPKIVFLDFNLSEKFTGYELTEKIKSLLPSTKVLLLLGTFDTVDDAAMEKCGASEKIVKPFDSNKFIALSKKLIETFAEEDQISYPEEKKPDEKAVVGDADDQWTMNHTTEQKFPEAEKPLDQSIPLIQNPLAKEISDWGMSIPGVIGEAKGEQELPGLPPVIGKESKPQDENRGNKTGSFEAKFPENADLDYPELEELTSEVTDEAPGSQEGQSKLIPIDSFHEAEGFEMQGSYVPEESDVNSIEAQIRDEVEGDLWKADEFEDLKREVSSKIEEVQNNFKPSKNDFDESLFRPLDDKESIDWDDRDDLFGVQKQESASQTLDQGRLEELVKKYVKEYMDELFLGKVEKVAWDVIPDLAENLIRQELSKIASKIHD